MKRVMVGGVFNVIHPGHIYFLKKAKEYGDYLIVVIATDKTAGRKALFPAKVRKEMIESLNFVDKVIIGDDRDQTKVIKKEKPDIVVLGYDQDMELENIPIKKIDRYLDYSTRDIVSKIKKRRN